MKEFIIAQWRNSYNYPVKRRSHHFANEETGVLVWDICPHSYLVSGRGGNWGLLTPTALQSSVMRHSPQPVSRIFSYLLGRSAFVSFDCLFKMWVWLFLLVFLDFFFYIRNINPLLIICVTSIYCAFYFMVSFVSDSLPINF